MVVQMVIEFTFCGTVALRRVAALSTSSLQECTDEHMEIGPAEPGDYVPVKMHHHRQMRAVIISSSTTGKCETDCAALGPLSNPGSNKVHKVHEKPQPSSICLSQGFSQCCPPRHSPHRGGQTEYAPHELT